MHDHLGNKIYKNTRIFITILFFANEKSQINFAHFLQYPGALLLIVHSQILPPPPPV